MDRAWWWREDGDIVGEEAAAAVVGSEPHLWSETGASVCLIDIL